MSLCIPRNPVRLTFSAKSFDEFMTKRPESQRDSGLLRLGGAEIFWYG